MLSGAWRRPEPGRGPSLPENRFRPAGMPLQGELVCTMLSDMSTNAQKTITGRELRRGTPEERLMPGESITVKKQGGKVFELKRVDVREKSILKGLDQLLEEVPSPRKPARTNLARIIIENRE
jgi:hypothetical protein